MCRTVNLNSCCLFKLSATINWFKARYKPLKAIHTNPTSLPLLPPPVCERRQIYLKNPEKSDKNP